MNRQRKNGQNLRQRALLTSYPEPKDFYEDYSPDLQAKLITCNAQLAGLATNRGIPTLGLLSTTYGEAMPLQWIKIQMGTLNDFVEVKTKLTSGQLDELSSMIFAEYYYLNVAEISLFIARLKLGRYGQFYGAIDPMKITNALLEFISDRHRDIDRKEMEENNEKLMIDFDERKSNDMPYTEYLEIKKRAEAGDEEAKELLKGKPHENRH